MLRSTVFIGAGATDFGLDPVERSDPFQGLGGNRCRWRFGEVEPLSPPMGPTECNAISLVTAPGEKLSATIAAFSAVLQRRRRGVPVNTSTRRNVCSLIGKLLGKLASHISQERQDHPINGSTRKMADTLCLLHT